MMPWEMTQKERQEKHKRQIEQEVAILQEIAASIGLRVDTSPSPADDLPGTAFAETGFQRQYILFDSTQPATVKVLGWDNKIWPEESELRNNFTQQLLKLGYGSFT